MKKLLYGCAYYDEYMPEERLARDMRMMREAGMNLIRIAESTWASEEPREGGFDFSHVIRAIEAAKAEGISVIVGTPTYAIPPWLAAKYPEIIAVTEQGPGRYGARQNMDITNPDYLRHAERIIRKLMEAVQPYENVIGFQLDNETKHYHTAGPNVHQWFIDWLREQFGSIDAVNEAFGFAYWSNRVDCWEHLPDPSGTINGSYWAAFENFRHQLVTNFLLWQRSIVDEYRRPDQFVTHNFDFGWRGSSFGVQPDVDHDQAVKAVTVAGCDIYHPSQDALTGKEIAFCGSLTRCLKQENYLVLETEAQGFPQWTPFPGQLRLQAFSHLAAGANCVEYWHWHSLHNAIETYWKGVLSHDLRENRIYREAAVIGAEFARLSDQLVNLKKQNRVAILVSNPSLTAMGPAPMFPLPDYKTDYNDVVRQYADALYELNVEYDAIFPGSIGLSRYDLLIVPALYSAPEALLQELKNYAENGGTLLAAVKCGFTDEHVKVYHDQQPHLLHESFGASYQEFTVPGSAVLKADAGFPEASGLSPDGSIRVWMELLEPGEARTLAEIDHPAWSGYAAITENAFGKGTAVYAGCLMNDAWTKALVRHALARAGISTPYADLYPVVVKSGISEAGSRITYYLNFSGVSHSVPCASGGRELLADEEVAPGASLTLGPWDVKIIGQQR